MSNEKLLLRVLLYLATVWLLVMLIVSEGPGFERENQGFTTLVRCTYGLGFMIGLVGLAVSASDSTMGSKGS